MMFNQKKSEWTCAQSSHMEITQPGKKHIFAYISQVGNVPRLFALHFGHRGCRALEENTLVKREI